MLENLSMLERQLSVFRDVHIAVLHLRWVGIT